MSLHPRDDQDQQQFYCPCCGYPGLTGPAYSEMPQPPFGDLGEPPYIGRFGYASFECCDCCGFEFGYDDDAGACGRARSFRQYRTEFQQSDQEWFRGAKRPDDWNFTEQLNQAGIQ
jgi:hypothetical protein